MNIDIKAEEYFEQLLLMERQYGQEEDLYPYIYMLLQMAECKKKELLKEEYKDISIRDVHIAKSSISFNAAEENEQYWKMRFDLIKKVGAPDFAVIEINKDKSIADKYIGCVEIKKLNKKLFNEELPSNMEMGLPNEFCYLLGYYKKPAEKIIGDNYRIVKAKIEEFNKKLEPEKRKINNIDYGSNFLLSYENEEELEIVIEEICKCVPALIVKSQGKGVWKYTTDKLPAGSESNQLAGNLDKYKKVIFTNGLEFYYLEKGELKGRKYNIGYVQLADLTEEYKKYKQSKEANKEYDFGKAKEQWGELIITLAIINWYKEKNIDEVTSYINSLRKEIITGKEGESNG